MLPLRIMCCRGSTCYADFVRVELPIAIRLTDPCAMQLNKQALNVSRQVINLELNRGGNHLPQPLAMVRSFSGIFASPLGF